MSSPELPKLEDLVHDVVLRSWCRTFVGSERSCKHVKAVWAWRQGATSWHGWRSRERRRETASRPILLRSGKRRVPRIVRSYSGDCSVKLPYQSAMIDDSGRYDSRVTNELRNVRISIENLKNPMYSQRHEQHLDSHISMYFSISLDLARKERERERERDTRRTVNPIMDFDRKILPYKFCKSTYLSSSFFIPTQREYRARWRRDLKSLQVKLRTFLLRNPDCRSCAGGEWGSVDTARE